MPSLRLIAESDVLLESFRPGVLGRLGLSIERLRRDYPRLIVCSITGYGQAGPGVSEAGHDLNYLARAGLLWATGTRSGEPVVPGFQLADIAGGTLYAISAIVTALYKRERRGEGAALDISMAEGALSFNIPALAMYAAGNAPVGPGVEMLNGGIACYSIYQTQCGGHMALAALEPKFWSAFCEATGFDPGGLQGHERGPEGEELRAALEALFVTRTRDEWAELLEAVDCCCVPVRRTEEVSKDPLFVARDLFFEIEHADAGPVRHIATPLTPPDRSGFSAPPRLGQHTEEVLKALGVTPSEIQSLQQRDVIAIARVP